MQVTHAGGLVDVGFSGDMELITKPFVVLTAAAGLVDACMGECGDRNGLTVVRSGDRNAEKRRSYSWIPRDK